ncbi:MAG: hypothetical protein IJO97_02860 [Lachnospiraceae bacterium]|nr:hypothetical protein [Lachnospiraceae bacterium]
MKNKNGAKLLVVGIILAVLVIGYYFYLSNRQSADREEVVESTLVQSVLMKDLEKSYPPTPKEVVKYFNEISKCFYNETYTEEELYDLAMQIQGLYDDELIARKTEEQYITDLKSDIAEMQANKRTISSYQLSASTDVEFFSENESKCARLYCEYSILQGTDRISSMVVFVLRQDENEHWKILGWDLDE